MTWPLVDVNQVNQLLGEVTEVERTALFIGTVPSQLSHLTPCGARDE